MIDRYENEYIFGTAYTLIDNKPISKTTLVGSITPLGNVLLAFHNGDVITSGQGRFIRNNGVWQFLIQTNSLNSILGNVIGISHWSYIVKITVKDREYNHLPGVNISVSNFIDMFNK